MGEVFRGGFIMGQYIKQVTCFLCGGRGGTYYSDGYSCYSCGANVNLQADVTKPPKLKEILKFPEGITFDPDGFTLDVREWLAAAGISDNLIKKYSIGCVPKLNSVVLPVFINTELKSYTTRSFNKNKKSKHKYITRGSKKASRVLHGEEKDPHTLVLVEDILSCIRVAEYLPCFCLQGTSISDKMVDSLTQKYFKIIIWTDADEGGDKGAEKLKAQFRKSNLKKLEKNLWENNENFFAVNRIRTTKDPKELNNAEMYKVIKQIKALNP